LERTVAFDKLETDTNYQQYAEELERNTAYEQKRTESNKIQKIYKSDMEMKVTKNGAELYKRQLGLDQKNAELRNETSVNQAECQLKLQKKRMEFQADSNTFSNALDIGKEEDKLKLKSV